MPTSRDEFVNLHVHDEYSPLDGAGKTADFVRRAVELGQSALAQTNHGYLLGTHVFYKECLKNGIKPIIGLETYVAPGSRLHKEPVFWGTPEQKRDDLSGSGKYTHLTLLATGPAGLRNLFKLSTESFLEGFYSKPRIDLALLEQHREGLVILSGCLSGELQKRISLDQIDLADNYVGMMKERFGDAFYIEVMDHDFERESSNIPTTLALARAHDVKVCATNDSHYVGRGDADVHDALLCVGTQAKLADKNRMRFDGHGYYLKSRSEMGLLALPEASLDTTLEIADRVESYESVFQGTRRFPEMGYSDPEAELTRQVRDKLRDAPREYLERAEYELSVINPEGFANYFLVQADITRNGARRKGVWVGPGRGSAAGSLVAFVLGITGLDPIKHGLYFERFLNPSRVSPPDIDSDFQASRRQEVIDYAVERYGQENVARIQTIGRIGAKKALEDAARVLGHPRWVAEDLKRGLPDAEFGREPDLSTINKSTVAASEQHSEVYLLASKLEGFARGTGMHAGGIVISPVPVSDVLPTFIPKRSGEDAQVTTQFDMHSVEELGLVKLDELGLSMGDVISHACKLAGTELPAAFDDPAVYDLLRTGHTEAVFQLGAPGVRALLKRLGPRDFGDIVAILALYRPGPMGANAHNDYAARRNGREVVSYPHPEFAGPLSGVLGPTYGVIVYQEQVMSALQTVCGYSLGDADLVRKAMGKKDRELLASEYGRFHDGGIANGFSDGALKALWDVLVPFADYSFNKAHATGYAVLAYWTAWLKVHHPREYMAAVLTYEGDPNKTQEFVVEVGRLGIPILAPSINGLPGWTPSKEGLRYGLTSIKGVGPKVTPPLLRSGPYGSWDQFLRNAPKAGLNIGVVRALAQAGALDSFGNRESILVVAEAHIQAALKERADLKKGKVGWGRLKHELPDYPINLPQRQSDELRLLGTKLSAQTLVLRAPAFATENTWEYLRRLSGSRLGTSPLTVRYGSWEFDTGLRVDYDSVRRGAEASGFLTED